MREGERAVRGGSARGMAGGVWSVLAGLFLWAALAAPSAYAAWNPGDLVKFPLVALVFAVLAVLLPDRPRRVVGLGFGALTGMLVVLKALNIGFGATLGRPFDVVDDWGYLRTGADVLTGLVGPLRAGLVVAGALVATLAALVVLPVAAVRVADVLARHRPRAVPVLALLTAGWVALAVAGVGWGRATPAAAASTSDGHLLWETVRRVPEDLADRAAFARDIAADRYARVPAADLLVGLRGKDVLVVFVESYGRVALDDPALAPVVRPALAEAQARLAAAGYATRSTWLRSPTFGGASWLAHSSVQSGLWVDSQRRYNQLVTSGRLTLTRAFGAAGWRTVFVVPAMDRPWPQGKPFYGFDALYTSTGLGYRGAHYGYATMPDQYTLQAFAERELPPGPRRPVMAEIDLLSSHFPWTVPPPLLPAGAVGDGAAFTGPDAARRAGAAPSPREVYAEAVAYAMRALAAFAVERGDPNLVILALGDHQPNGSVTSPRASHDVPGMLIARDPQVLARAAGWGWQPGLVPGPDAPVRPMSELRDGLLAAFGRG